MAGQGMVDGLELPVDGLAGIQGGALQGAPLVEDSVKLKWTAERLVEGAQKRLGGFALLAGALDDELDHLQADLRQQGRVMPLSSWRRMSAKLADGAGKVEFGDEPLQLVGDVGVHLDVKGAPGSGAARSVTVSAWLPAGVLWASRGWVGSSWILMACW